MDEKIVKDLIDRLIDLSFAEDIGDGDHTTLSCIPADAMGKSKLLIKEEGILAGIEIAKEVFHRFDPEMKVEVFIQDGTHVKPGDVAWCRRKDPVFASDRTPDAEHHAAYERYCYDDQQIRRTPERYEDSRAGYT